MLSRMKNIIYKIMLCCKIKAYIIKYNKKIYLIGTPWYGNLGDHAITLGEKFIIKENFPDHKIIDIPYNIYFSKLSKIFRFKIAPSDMIYLQGGGNLGSLYPQEENLRRDVIKRYKKNKIIVMPVSIFFHNNDFGKMELEKSSKIYNSHPNLTIVSRDEMSFDFAKKYFYKVNNILAPDAVTSLDGVLSDVNVNRKGVQFFLRKDIEKILSDDVINKVKFYLSKHYMQYNVSDTTVPYEVKDEQRKQEVFSRLIMARKARLVITDRYHGLIFSVITRTPVIVFKSFDTKISSGVKWFKELEWVHYMDSNDLDNVFKIINKYCLYEEYKIKTMTKCKDIVISTIKNAIFNEEKKQ